MSQHFQVIYENDLLRPLSPLDYPEKSVLEVDVRVVKENGKIGTFRCFVLAC
jgi:predicted DNA-binding antitoxin AbrB/MazE fold protein